MGVGCCLCVFLELDHLVTPPPLRSGGGEAPATYHLKHTAVFTQGLPRHEDNDAIEQKLPHITVTNLPYREFYRGHELKATF